MLSNTHFAISVHVLTALAYNEGTLVASDDLAKTVGTNPSFLRGLIGDLRQAGLVETRLGKKGGTQLANAPGSISLLDVYRATETKPPMTTHECDGKSPCVVARNMGRVLLDLNERLEEVIESELAKITLADVVREYVAGGR